VAHSFTDDAVENAHGATIPRFRRRIWSEFLPWAELVRPAVLARLERHRLEVIVAVTPEALSRVLDLVARFRERGLPVHLWPMLEPAHGPWPSLSNQARFFGFVARLLGTLHQRDALPAGIALDLEPALGEMRLAAAGDVRTALRWIARRPARSRYAELVRDVRSLGLETVAALVPAVLADRGPHGWQRALDVVSDELGADVMNAMAYSSMFEGYSRGLVSRNDARALVHTIARASAARFGSRASMSLGLVGAGALGDEPVYRSVAELREDVACARAAGVDDLALYDLGAVLARPRAEEWLEAFVATPSSAGARPTVRSRLVVASVWAGSKALARLGRVIPARARSE
jgi:hypothetical protein